VFHVSHVEGIKSNFIIKKKKFPVEARFFAHVQTGPGAHPASCTMGTGYFPGVKASMKFTAF
jgi:hypothetical protein